MFECINRLTTYTLQHYDSYYPQSLLFGLFNVSCRCIIVPDACAALFRRCGPIASIVLLIVVLLLALICAETVLLLVLLRVFRFYARQTHHRRLRIKRFDEVVRICRWLFRFKTDFSHFVKGQICYVLIELSLETY